MIVVGIGASDNLSRVVLCYGIAVGLVIRIIGIIIRCVLVYKVTSRSIVLCVVKFILGVINDILDFIMGRRVVNILLCVIKSLVNLVCESLFLLVTEISLVVDFVLCLIRFFFKFRFRIVLNLVKELISLVLEFLNLIRIKV